MSVRLVNKAYKRLLRKAYQEIKEEYPDKLAHIETCLHCINDYESQGITNLDEISKYFGEVMGEICAYKDDEWHDELYELDLLGKLFILLMLMKILNKNLKKGTYNPFKELYQTDQFEDKCKDILELMISEAPWLLKDCQLLKMPQL